MSEAEGSASWMRASAFVGIIALLAASPAVAEEVSIEHSLVLELGGAADWPLQGGKPNYGGNIVVEKEVIEGWLEIEAGLSPFGSTSSALSGDLLFKKPYRLSPTAEFMFGVGPSIDRTFGGRDRGTTASAEFVADFMFWPQANVGWFIEPAFSINPATGRKSFGATGGLLIGFE